MRTPEWVYSGLARGLPALHRGIWRISRGQFGSHFGRVEFCLLTTTGRTTGQRRTTPLVLVRDNLLLLLVASNGGSKRQPDWYLNLVAHPQVMLDTKGARDRKIARVASEKERVELWPKVSRVYRGYDLYQARTDREIPIVVLEEDSGRSPK